MALTTDPSWALVHEPGLLLVHAGADELFVIDDVGDDAAAEVLALWRAPVIEPGGASPEAAAIVEQLRSAGILRDVIECGAAPTLAVRFAGTRDAPFAEALAGALPAPIAVVGDERDAEIVVIVRTDASLADVVADGHAELATPHLLVDLAFGHTICAGPLVFPGESACLACLAGRLSYYWGDVAPPPRPRMTEHPQLAAGLAALLAGNVLLREDRTLVNRTVSYDFAGHDVRSNAVYRLPSCPVCATTPRPGAIELPWASAR